MLCPQEFSFALLFSCSALFCSFYADVATAWKMSILYSNQIEIPDFPIQISLTTFSAGGPNQQITIDNNDSMTTLYGTWYGTCVWHDIEAILSVASENASMDDLWMS